MVFFEGYLIGLALIVLIGPVLFVLLGVTISHGRHSGYAVACGIFVSDIVAVTMIAFGLSSLIFQSTITSWFGVGGGVVLMGLGLRYLFIKPPKPDARQIISSGGLMKAFTSGFLVNFVNPFVFMIWMGIIATAGARHGSGSELYIYLSGCVLGVFTLDMLKVIFADRIHALLNPVTIRWMFRGVGTLMCLFSFRLFFTGVSVPG